jgi:hypothetical protein
VVFAKTNDYSSAGLPERFELAQKLDNLAFALQRRYPALSQNILRTLAERKKGTP